MRPGLRIERCIPVHVPMLCRFVFSVSLLGLVLAMSPSARSQAPRLIPYQGVLEDGGSPVTTSTSLVFTLYDAASGGTAVWTETQGLTPDADGRFTVNLGSKTAFTSSVFDAAVWLEVTVGGTALGPRTALGAAPFALGLSLPIRATEASGSYLLDLENSDSGVLRTETSSGSAYAMEGRTTAEFGTAIRGYALASTGTARGVWGLSNADRGTGVYGRAAGTTGESIGVDGLAFSPNGYGVRGVVTSSTRGIGVLGTASGISGHGVEGRASGSGGVGVYGESAGSTSSSVGVAGEAKGLTGSTRGVNGTAASTNGRGVFGQASASSGFTYGVWGESSSTSGTAVFGFAQALTGTTYAFRTRVDSPDGYSAFLTGGRGVHVETSNINLQDSALLNEDITVESEDAVVGLYSENAGSWGSALVLGEIRSDGLNNKWSIARGTGTSGSLHFTSGLNANYSSNNTVMRIDTDGSVHADGSFTGGGADFAEWLPLASSSEVPRAGDVVGVTAGRVGLATDGAEQVMIVSSNPAFVGNPDAADGGALVALVGQAEVRLASPAQVGDLLVASGASDGTARAVLPARYNPATDGAVIGRVLALAEDGRAIALVGVGEAAALRDVVARQQDELAAQQRQLEALTADRDRQQAQIDALARRLDAQDSSNPNRPISDR